MNKLIYPSMLYCDSTTNRDSLPIRVGVKYIEMYLSKSTLLIFRYKYKYKSFSHQSTYVQVLFKVLKYEYKYFSLVNGKVK